MSGLSALPNIPGLPIRLAGLALAVLLHWTAYELMIEPARTPRRGLAEPIHIYDVPLPKEPDPPLVAWRGDATVTPPQPVGPNAAQARLILAQLSEAGPVSIRFIVDANGRVRECNVGGQVMAMDEGRSTFGCDQLRALRFRPAVDRQGRPVDYVLP